MLLTTEYQSTRRKSALFPLFPPSIAHVRSGEEPGPPPYEPSKHIRYIVRWSSYLIHILHTNFFPQNSRTEEIIWEEQEFMGAHY